MKIVSVLRSGIEYGAEQAQFLHRQLPPDAVCLTNLPSIPGVDTLPLEYSDELHGWWSKMELFNPAGPLGGEDLFYIDCDSVIVDDIGPMLDAVRGRRELVMLGDFYHPQHPASGVMYIPARIKQRIWSAWSVNPYWYMVRRRPAGRGGDQGFIGEAARHIDRWDDVCPGAIVSYKCSVQASGQVPDSARIIAFHGNPRPWSLKELPCKQSLSVTTPESNGSDNCKTPSPVPQRSSTAPTKVRTPATARRSKSRKR